jgi:hypothetical protein
MDVVSALRQLRGGGVVRMATREVQRMAKGKKGGGPPAASAKKGAGMYTVTDRCYVFCDLSLGL